jgi:YegS/Rv2252/BmrU family lipid kinase
MSDDERVIFILNPKSANGVTRKRFERARAYAEEVIGSIDVRFTERPMHATELAREAVRGKARAVISVGGDGTINEVVNGFFDESYERIDSPTAFGVVTSGTGGDFRRTLGFPVDPRKDLDRIGRFQTRKVDVGRCDYTTPSGGAGTRMFMNIGSMGVSGDIVNAVNTSSKALGAKLSFLRGTLSTLMTAPPNFVRLTFDGETEDETRKVTFIAVSNGQYFGGSMHVAPQAEIDDGSFDVVIAEGEGFGFWVKNAAAIYRGTHTSLPNIHVKRCSEVRAEPTGKDVLIELDGEQPGRLPATFRVVPATLDLIC